jgi:hypothetical protein
MKRLVPLAVIATVALGTFVSTSAGAADVDVCTLVTKKEASKILGAKVVKVTSDANASTGDQECEYRTNRYVSKRLQKLRAPLKLKVTLGTLTDELRGQIDDNLSELDPISDLGDEAYLSGTDVLVISGPDILQAEATNWQGSPSKYEAMSEAAARTAIARLTSG